MAVGAAAEDEEVLVVAVAAVAVADEIVLIEAVAEVGTNNRSCGKIEE
jgi:hypothetical protein